MRSSESIRYEKMEHFGYGPNVMKKIKLCSRCGTIANVKVRICPDCGEQLTNETLYDNYKRQHASCPDCDTVLAPGSRYCPNCGRKLT